MRKIQALNGARVGPAVRRKPTTASICARRPATTPPMLRPWPSMYLVAEWITTSAPSFSGCCSAGVQKQLSTASSAPRAWAISASAAMSTSSASGLDGDSTNSSLVFGLQAASQPFRSLSAG
ncbi:hypothetical protein D3C76_1010180 [compost metagenome]